MQQDEPLNVEDIKVTCMDLLISHHRCFDSAVFPFSVDDVLKDRNVVKQSGRIDSLYSCRTHFDGVGHVELDVCTTSRQCSCHCFSANAALPVTQFPSQAPPLARKLTSAGQGKATRRRSATRHGEIENHMSES